MASDSRKFRCKPCQESRRASFHVARTSLSRLTRPRSRRRCRQPLGDQLRVGVDELLGGLVVAQPSDRDRTGDRVLVVVGPLEVLDQRVGRAAGVGELRRDDLVQVVGRVVAGDLRRVGVAAGGVRRQVDLHQLDLAKHHCGS